MSTFLFFPFLTDCFSHLIMRFAACLEIVGVGDKAVRLIRLKLRFTDSIIWLELAVTDSGFGIHTRHRCTLVAYLCLFSVIEWLTGGCNEQKGKERLRVCFSVTGAEREREREIDLMDGGMMVGMK